MQNSLLPDTNGNAQPVSIPTRRIIHVLLVGFDSLLRHGIESITQTASDIYLVGEVDTGDDAIKQAVALGPDVVLTEAQLPDRSVIDVLRTLKERCPKVRILVLSSFGDTQLGRDVMTAGAHGYILKNIGGETLLSAIRAVYGHQTILGPTIANDLVWGPSVTRHRDGDDQPSLQSLPALSQYDTKVLIRVAKGLTDKQIAAQLFFSESAVKSRLRNLYQRLRLKNRAHAAVYALEQHLLPNESSDTENGSGHD